MALLLATALFAVGAYASIAALRDAAGRCGRPRRRARRTRRGCSSWRSSRARSPSPSRRSSAAAAASAVGGIALFASFIVSGYASSLSALQPLEPLSYFSITAGHRPIAGRLGLAGRRRRRRRGGRPARRSASLAFVRRDLLVPTGGRVRLPTLPIFLAGPFTRALGERLPASIVWGAALGLFGLIIAFSVDEFVATLSSIPEIVDLIQRIFPDADILSAGGFLQLAFFSEAILIVSIATAALVGGWASDEGDRRLELLLLAAGQPGRLGRQERPRRHGRRSRS